MERVKISLNTMGKIQNFVNEIEKHQGDFYLESGEYRVNASSIIGIFNLDLGQPVVLIMENVQDPDLVEDALKKVIL